MNYLADYSTSIVDKVARLSDILIKVGQIQFLKERLSLYGGTAINLVRVKKIPRLSVDIDFNYREPYGVDWGQERDMIKRVFKDLGYPDDSVKVQPSYPLSRLEVKYETDIGYSSSVKVETGYLRRFPILIKDEICEFTHPSSGQQTEILTPKKEELYANKFCTLFSRSDNIVNGRDLFDVWTISNQSFDPNLFMDSLFVETVLMDVDLKKVRGESRPSAETGPLNDLINTPDLAHKLNAAWDYAYKLIDEALENGWEKFHVETMRNEKFAVHHLKNSASIHPNIDQHPSFQKIIKDI